MTVSDSHVDFFSRIFREVTHRCLGSLEIKPLTALHRSHCFPKQTSRQVIYYQMCVVVGGGRGGGGVQEEGVGISFCDLLGGS